MVLGENLDVFIVKIWELFNFKYFVFVKVKLGIKFKLYFFIRNCWLLCKVVMGIVFKLLFIEKMIMLIL